MKSSEQAADNLVFWRGFLLPISLYVVLGSVSVQFGILAGVFNVYLTLFSSRSGPWAMGIGKGFLLQISLNVVLGAGCAQFGILAVVSNIYITL